MKLPHPVILLVAGVAVCAALTWILPAGQYDRRDDPATGRSVVVAGTYHRVDPAPVGPFAAAVAIPRGFVEAADVIGVVLFVGAAWIVVDRIGTLGRLIAALVGAFGSRGLIAIPVVSLFFATMGALENMQEEIIPLVPALLLLGRGLGVDAVSVVAMSTGAAAIGSAFGPTNPFQAGIAMKLAQLPPMSAAAMRWTTFVAALALWVAWTMWHAGRSRGRASGFGIRDSKVAGGEVAPATGRDYLVLAIAIAPIAAYVYGSVALGWGFNELSGGFLVAGCVAGLLGGLGVAGTTAAFLEGMQGMLPAAILIGAARALSLVLTDGHVTDTILDGLAAPLSRAPAAFASLLMIPFHAIVHVAVPSVSGQAVLTMPILVPLSDLLGISRQVTVLAYQTGAGLTELLTPTNGGLMAVLLAAGVPFSRWITFAVVGVLLALAVGVAGIFALSAV
ncbi:MAG TPA: Na+/H+ antiporter NhaC family protein [Vicinamibacterales bacterium]